jgi:hypothetical protein
VVSNTVSAVGAHVAIELNTRKQSSGRIVLQHCTRRFQVPTTTLVSFCFQVSTRFSFQVTRSFSTCTDLPWVVLAARGAPNGARGGGGGIRASSGKLGPLAPAAATQSLTLVPWWLD